eukprot:scaffold5684_cov169-Amphora_coffeaeformis.AAC.17
MVQRRCQQSTNVAGTARRRSTLLLSARLCWARAVVDSRKPFWLYDSYYHTFVAFAIQKQYGT